MESSSYSCCRPIINLNSSTTKLLLLVLPRRLEFITPTTSTLRRRNRVTRASSTVDESSNFAHRIEQAWLISQQPSPVACSSCDSKGNIECKWCSGTGFFILGNNMLCQVPSRDTTCVICAGKGSACCSDCKGTGYRAKWLGEPPVTK